MDSGGMPASQFSMDGSTPSPFTMPGGSIPNTTDPQLMPATLGGVNGMQDAQDYTQMVKDSRDPMDLSGLKNLKMPEQKEQQPLGGMARGQARAVDFTPMYSMNMPQQGQTTQQNFNGLLQMLAGANKGYRVI